MPKSKQKLLIDTDPGQDIDDLLALFFALRRPELEVCAVTTVTYPSDRRARLVKRLLRYLGRTDIPVAAGVNYPLRPFSQEERRAQHDLGRVMNHDAFAQPDDPRDLPDATDAVDLIIRTVEAHAGEIVLACIAPLTNIACALCRRPDLAGKIQYIAMMGGELALNRSEHNVAFDYNAADIVLSAGIPLYMGTWDVTRRLVLSQEDCRRFGTHASAVCQALARAMELWHPAQSWKPGPVMYDLFPMVWAFERTLYTTKPMAVRVETRGEHTLGMTVAAGPSTTMHVTTEANAEGLRQLYLDTVLA